MTSGSVDRRRLFFHYGPARECPGEKVLGSARLSIRMNPDWHQVGRFGALWKSRLSSGFDPLARLSPQVSSWLCVGGKKGPMSHFGGRSVSLHGEIQDENFRF